MGSIRILQASAGSGKTFSLAYQYIKSVISEPNRYREILAVTFTNKATEQMKRRIIDELYLLSRAQKSAYLSMLISDLSLDGEVIQRRAKRAQSLILHDYSRFCILTIDKFFQRIIRSFLKELGMDLNFNIELKTQGILERAADNLIEKISSEQQLKQWITAYLDEKIELGGRWDVKTQLIELGSEIFKESFNIETVGMQTLGDTVSEAAKKVNIIKAEMIDKAKKIVALAEGAALAITDFNYGKTGVYSYVLRVAKGDIAPPGARALSVANGSASWAGAKSAKKQEIMALESQLTPLLCDLCQLYSSNEPLFNSYKIIRQNYRNFAMLQELSQRIREIYAQENILHISETNRILKSLISGNDIPFVFEKVGNIYTEFMIDEFQDTSSGQWQNFVPLLSNALASSEGESALLVGDIKQSIYRWRGGDWRILNSEAQQTFDQVTMDSLKTNYRSSKNVVDFNNELIDRITLSDNEQLNEMVQGGFPEYHDLLKNAYKNHRQLTKNDVAEGYVNVCVYDKNNEGEKPLFIEKVEALQKRGFMAGDIAILVRTNAQASMLASTLLAYKRLNPASPYVYDVVTQEALLIGSSVDVNFIVACLSLAIDAEDGISLSVMNKFLGLSFDEPLSEDRQEFLGSIRCLSPLEAFESVISYFSLGYNTKELAYIQAFHSQIITYLSTNIADTREFLSWWTKTGFEQSINIPQSRNAITIMSIHKSKGLEFKAVILPFCNWSLSPKTGSVLWGEPQGEEFDRLGNFPASWTNDMENSCFRDDYIKEQLMSHIDNINTFYVATTRAEKELHIMIPKMKTSGGRINSLIEGAVSSATFLQALSGRVSQGDNFVSYEFGEPVTQVQLASGEMNVFEHYPSRRVGARENLSRSSKEHGSEVLSPRNYGILMHSLFENAHSLDEALQKIELMTRDCILNDVEAEDLKLRVAKAMENPTVASWFEYCWDDVKTEREIIMPGMQSSKRPDRVMIKGSKAIVVDYKFGLSESGSYSRQIQVYRSLLEGMGYSDVECYIWYVSLDKVEQM